MKKTQKMAVLGSMLGLMLVSGAVAAEERMTPTLQFGEHPTMYDNLRDQHASDMTMAPKGARGPVRTESMEHQHSFGESPSNYETPISIQQEAARDSGSSGGWNNLMNY